MASKIRDEADRLDRAEARRRSRGRSARPADSSSEAGVLPVAGSGGTPSQVLVQHEDLQLLNQALDRLALESSEYRDLIVAVKLDGKTYVEIAAETGKTPDSIRMRVNRAMEALTRILRRQRPAGNERPHCHSHLAPKHIRATGTIDGT